MHRLVVIVLVAALSLQSSAATTDADIQDPVLQQYAKYLESIPDNAMGWWKSTSAQRLRNTVLGERLNALGRQLSDTWVSNDCVKNLRKDYGDLKNQAIKVYNVCAESLAPSADTIQQLQTEINEALDGLKKYDAQIKEETQNCENLNNSWAQFTCEAALQGRLIALRIQARTSLTMTLFNDIRNQIQQNADKLNSCITENTTTLLQEINKAFNKFFTC